MRKENETSLPDENSEMDDEAPDHSSPALPAVAWWEKERHATTPAPGNPSESSWLSRSPPRDKDISIAEEPEPQYVDSQYSLQEGHKAPKDNLWTSYDKQIEQEEDPKTEQSTSSDNPSPVFNREHGDEIPHLSDIDKELDDSGHTVDVAGKAEDTAQDSANEVPDTNGNEDQQSSNDVHSALVERVESHKTSHATGDEESNPIRVKERDIDSGSETVDHPEIEPHNAPHEQVHDHGKAHQHPAEDSTTREAEQDHSESQSSNLTPTESSKPQFSHASSAHVEHAGDIHPTADGSFMEPEDQEHDGLGDYASGDMTPHAATQPDHNQEDNMEKKFALPKQ